MIRLGRASAVAAISAFPLLAGPGCGGESLPPEAGGVAESLAEAGYASDQVASVSAFSEGVDTALVVDGNEIPTGSIVGVEFVSSDREAAKLEKRYEKINAAVAVEGTVVYSALTPVDEEQLDAVVAAANP